MIELSDDARRTIERWKAHAGYALVLVGAVMYALSGLGGAEIPMWGRGLMLVIVGKIVLDSVLHRIIRNRLSRDQEGDDGG